MAALNSSHSHGIRSLCFKSRLMRVKKERQKLIRSFFYFANVHALVTIEKSVSKSKLRFAKRFL